VGNDAFLSHALLNFTPCHPKSHSIVFGAGFIGNAEGWISGEDLHKASELISKYGVTKLDPAQLYGESERRLGEMKAGERFELDTKSK
jgi:hypothetical protein